MRSSVVQINNDATGNDFPAKGSWLQRRNHRLLKQILQEVATGRSSGKNGYKFSTDGPRSARKISYV